MEVSSATLGRAAGACAATAGALFIFIQLIHPADELASVTTTGWKVTHLLTLAMAVLGLIGVSGIYFVQVKRAGLLGLVGWLVYSSFFLVVLAWNFVEVVVMPLIVDDAPTLVSDLLALPGGDDVVGDVGGFAVANLLAAGTYLLGGILFGIATSVPECSHRGPRVCSLLAALRRSWFPCFLTRSIDWPRCQSASR